jgi:hypothetical protein
MRLVAGLLGKDSATPLNAGRAEYREFGRLFRDFGLKVGHVMVFVLLFTEAATLRLV